MRVAAPRPWMGGQNVGVAEEVVDVAPPGTWRTPEELLRVGVQRSRLILVNEANDGERRCIRTRRIGVRVVREAHDAGVRHLAMEALGPLAQAAEANASRRPPDAAGGSLAQPEMRELIGVALTLGWTLTGYEAELERRPPGAAPMSMAEINWRQGQQARHLAATCAALPPDAKLIVWCENGNLSKRAASGWRPMGSLLRELTGSEPFAIDQTSTVRFVPGQRPDAVRWQRRFSQTLRTLHGTAGFLAEEAPDGWPVENVADAYLLSIDNELT
jgi:hypothetical protein